MTFAFWIESVLWATVGYAWYETWRTAQSWKQIANQYKYTAEMWENMYQEERDHV